MIRTHSVCLVCLAAILLVATDLSEDHHLKQISSTYFAQNDQGRRIPNAPHYSASQLGRVLINRD